MYREVIDSGEISQVYDVEHDPHVQYSDEALAEGIAVLTEVCNEVLG